LVSFEEQDDHLSFDEHATRFAENCKECRGKRYVLENNKHVVCKCFLNAVIQHRLDQIPIDFRYKEWLDYVGITDDGKDIHNSNWKEARAITFAYCFSKRTIKNIEEINYEDIDQNFINKKIRHRASNSKILFRKNEGANLAIFGDEMTGKTLLASLVAKEIIYASVLLGNFDFKWLSFNTLINSISFDRINYDLVDEITCVDFLVLDNAYIPQQGNYMKNVLDEIFYDRLMGKMPTIITGSSGMENSEHFKKKDQYSGITARQAMGDEFYRLLNSSNTQKIVLKMGKN